ncbi:MAG: hypothetical protein KC586_23450 [Myxococcales bacterium]|nr:hypothetical protein [Myxococcales bacterium]
MARDDDASFDSYQDFLRTAVRRYWDRKGSSKVTFLALMFATRQAWGVAAQRGFSAETGKKALTGAAGVAAATVLIRIFLGGPLGLLLAGASAVSLIAVYGKNQEAIWKKVLRFRSVIDEYEDKYEGVSNREGSSEDRDLMMEGLLGRFLDELDRIPEDEEDEEDEPVKEDRGSFAAHVSRKRDETEG